MRPARRRLPGFRWLTTGTFSLASGRSSWRSRWSPSQGAPRCDRTPGFPVERAVEDFYEAMLAALAIVVGHLYYVGVNPGFFRLNRAMTRGPLTAAEMERDHSLETER